MADKDLLADAKEAFELCADAEKDNRLDALDDLKFARLGEQWPDKVRQQRTLDGRPILTINRMPAFIRQIVNDSRQNKPQIKVKPVDDKADRETAEILAGLIRNIEYVSKADVAYDTAVDFAVSCGFGYFRIAIDYEYDDSFDKGLKIKRIANPFSVYGDPHSTEADSSDWNMAFVTEYMKKADFEAKYKGAEQADWFSDGYNEMNGTWFSDDGILVAEYWTREKVAKTILLLSNGQVVGEEQYAAGQDLFMAMGIQPVNSRQTSSHQVIQRIMTGAEILEENKWAGVYIPIVPVYGEEVNVEGKRYFRSMIRDAKDAQRMLNYWKPLALDTPIATPSGWTTMGDIKIGDQVFDDTGKPANVIGKSPIHINRDCYEVTFDDGSKIVADAQHPWVVEERSKRTAAGTDWVRRDITTAELVPGKHFIDVTKPLELADADLPIDPYVLGLWLGDGASAAGRVTPGDADLDEVIARVRDRGYEIGAICDSNGTRHSTFTVVGLTSQLRAAGLIGNKHIPGVYLRASERQRWELLQGLMDTDGHINTANGACGFTTTSDALAAGFAELLRSLGFKAFEFRRAGRQFKVGNGGTETLPSVQFSFTAYADEPVFGLARKTAKVGGRAEHRRRTKRFKIKSVERVPSVPVQCIAIDAPSHLFLAGRGMVPTHNTTSTELVALAPRVPWIGEEGTFDADPNWLTANTTSHAYLQYAKGSQPPQRLSLDSGPAAGAMQEAMMASDDMKSIMGMFDASLGAKSNETSGRAIMARQREGDIGSFHFIDNLSRSIRHAGCILLDLIPKVYSGQRMVRVLGEDGEEQVAQIGSKPEDGEGMGADGSPQHEMTEAAKVYDLGLGKYDIAVDTGPGFTTRREETAAQMTEFVRAYPDAIPVIGDLLVKSLDWQHADEIADRLKAMNPSLQQGEGGLPPAAQQMMQQAQDMISQGAQELQKLQAENAQLKQKAEIEAQKLQIEAYKAQTERMQAEQQMAMPMPMSQSAVSPVSISVPEEVGGALAQQMAQTIAPIIAQTVAQTMQSLPPLRVDMPPPVKMRRVPIRDKNGLIIETRDEPILDDPAQGMVN